MSNLRAEFYSAKGSIWVRVRIVGETDEVERKMNEDDKRRFPIEWAAFEQGQIAPEPDGTPLTELENINDRTAAAYRAKGIRTVEELAALPDGALKGLGLGSLANREAAKTLLAERQGEAIAAIVAEAPVKRRTKAA